MSWSSPRRARLDTDSLLVLYAICCAVAGILIQAHRHELPFQCSAYARTHEVSVAPSDGCGRRVPRAFAASRLAASKDSNLCSEMPAGSCGLAYNIASDRGGGGR